MLYFDTHRAELVDKKALAKTVKLGVLRMIVRRWFLKRNLIESM